MKFAFMARILQYDGYGIQTFLAGILDGITQIQTNHEIVLLVEPNQDLSTFPFANNFEIAEVGTAADGLFSKFWWDHIEVGRVCKHLHIDALYAPAHVRPLYTPCPTAVLMPDMMYHLFPQDWNWSDRVYFRAIAPKFTVKADAILAISQNTKKDLLRFINIEKQKVQILYPGVPAGFTPQNQHEVNLFREKHKLTKPFILYVGSFHPRKNVLAIINAYEKIASTHPHDLVIAGVAQQKDEQISKKIQAMEVGKRIRQIGAILQNELPVLYSGAELFVFPSLYEGFGFPVLEALACGCPTITSNQSSLPEVAGNAAILVQPDDIAALAAAMKEVLDNPKLSNTLRQRSLERAKQFSWIKAAHQVLDTMEMIASK